MRWAVLMDSTWHTCTRKRTSPFVRGSNRLVGVITCCSCSPHWSWRKARHFVFANKRVGSGRPSTKVAGLLYPHHRLLQLRLSDSRLISYVGMPNENPAGTHAFFANQLVGGVFLAA